MNFDATAHNYPPEGPGMSALLDRWLADDSAWDLAATVTAYRGARPAKVQQYAEKMSAPAIGAAPETSLAPGILLAPVARDEPGEL